MKKDQWNPELYNQKHNFVFEYGESLIDLLQPNAKESVLDLGCGAGQLTHQISLITKNVVGLDQSGAMIQSARAQFPQLDFHQGDAADFHFKEPFDAIFSNATLHWVQDYHSAIKCMYNNLKSGGRIVVEFGGKGNIYHIITAMRKILKQYGFPEQAKREQWFFPSIGEYAPALEQAGFELSMAQLYDRPTLLADSQTGIIDWLGMFGAFFFEGISANEIEKIKTDIQQLLKPILFKKGNWYADYRRIRIVAFKKT